MTIDELIHELYECKALHRSMHPQGPAKAALELAEMEVQVLIGIESKSIAQVCMASIGQNPSKVVIQLWLRKED